MSIKMSCVPVRKIYFDSRTPQQDGTFEFTIDCGAVYFGAVYDNDGTLLTIDQYFFTENFSREALNSAVETEDLLTVDDQDYIAKAYLLTKNINGNEWLRFHAVVPEIINPDYFHAKYLGE